MYQAGLEIKNHQDAADFIGKYRTPLTTHFYDEGHFMNTEHLATPAEAREYLDLLLEIAKTFPKNSSEFVRYDGACFVTVARLMKITGIELSEHDKRCILDYTTVEYDSEYLNYACQIRDADIMIGRISDLWYQIALHESYYREAQALSGRINALSRLRLVKRFRLASQFAWWMDNIKSHAALMTNSYMPRALDNINSNYQSNLEYAYPLIFYHCPTSIAGKLFPDQQTEDEVRAEWESCDLYRKFGDEKLARLLDLRPGFTMEFFVYQPDTSEIFTGEDRAKAIIEAYPELEPYYYQHLAFDVVECGEDYISDTILREIIQNIARAFGAEQYLPMANYSRRRKLPNGEHPESEMSEGELAVAHAILDFMESTRE